MFIHFFCLCPLGLTFKLNLKILKVAYSVYEMRPHGIMVYHDSLQARLREGSSH